MNPKYYVIGVYEDDTSDEFYSSDEYEDCEKYIKITGYTAVYWKIEKRWYEKEITTISD